MPGRTRHDFWVHGLAAHVQNEPNPIATEEELRRVRYRYPNPRRNSQGTRVRQNAGSNWFHFAIPTPIVLKPNTNEEHLEVIAVLLRGTGSRCGIKAVHVWAGGAGGGEKIWEDNAPLPRSVDGEFEWQYDFAPYYRWREPLAIDVLVKFEDEGDITFGGAGVRFNAELPDWVEVRRRDAACLESFVRRA